MPREVRNQRKLLDDDPALQMAAWLFPWRLVRPLRRSHISLRGREFRHHR